MPISISASVGLGGRNKPTDVALVQQLLNHTGDHKLTIDGLSGSNTYEAIKAFQKSVVKLFKPDSLISPHGKTIKQLITFNKGTSRPSSDSKLGMSADKFVTLYQKEYSALNKSNLSGLSHLINFIILDTDITDIRWAAYMLATTKHETNHTMLPIEEYGKGQSKRYGKEITVTDKNGKEHKNIYFGRGYVQLTWDYNYKSISEKLEMDEDLYIYPEKVLDENIAYKIMSYGMRHGSFTSRKLSKYINGGQCDYINARRIINGTDRAQKIADFSVTLEILLRLCRTSSHSQNENFDCLTKSKVCVA